MTSLTILECWSNEFPTIGGKSVLLSSNEPTAGAPVFWCMVTDFGGASALLVAVSSLVALQVAVVARSSSRGSSSELYWLFV